MLQKKYDEQLTASGVNSASSGILRITTQHNGFNDGQPYYFSQIEDLRIVGTEARRSSIGDERGGIDLVEEHISRLSHAYKKVFAIETRFQRLQTGLRRTWNSFPFNMIILALIISNFIFTVKGMENTDPAADSFYERLDLIYTIIFAVGPPLSAAPRIHGFGKPALRISTPPLIPVAADRRFCACAELIFNFAAHALWPFLHGALTYNLCALRPRPVSRQGRR